MRVSIFKAILFVFAFAAPLPLYASEAPAATAAAPDRSEDLAAFRTEFLARDNSYSPEARAKAEAMLSALEKEAAGLSGAAFELRLAEIVALADNGHTLYFSGPWRSKYNRIPIRFVVLNDKLYVGAADAAHENLVGREVVGIAGRRWPELREALSRYQGGKESWKANFIQNFIESPEVLYAAGLNDKVDKVVIDTAGTCKIDRVTVKASKMDADLEGFDALIPPARIVEFARESAAADQPLYLQDAAALYRFQWLENDVAYIQFKANAGDSGGTDAKSFADDTLAKLQARQPKNIILDERFNSGGDLNNTRDLMQALPGLVANGGKVYEITSSKTFSAGISSTGYLKQAGGDKVVIVGESVGDRLEFWAEGDVMELPHSGGMVLYATERHNYMTGCPEDDCHGSIKRHPIAVDSVEPDYLTPLTWEAYAAGRDPSLEKVMELIGG